jgi:hypothetical protein
MPLRQQYWADATRPYEFVPVKALAEAFQASARGRANAAELASPVQAPPAQPGLDPLVRTRCSVCLPTGPIGQIKTP